MNGPRCRRKAAGLLARGAGSSVRRVGPSAREAARFAGCTGAERRRTRSQEREVLRKERHSCPQGWRVPRKGGEVTGSAVLSGALLPRVPPVIQAGTTGDAAGTPPTWM
jgi:hypothetical protein